MQQFSFSNCSNSKGHLVVLRDTRDATAGWSWRPVRSVSDCIFPLEHIDRANNFYLDILFIFVIFFLARRNWSLERSKFFVKLLFRFGNLLTLMLFSLFLWALPGWEMIICVFLVYLFRPLIQAVTWTSHPSLSFCLLAVPGCFTISSLSALLLVFLLFSTALSGWSWGKSG